MMKKMMSIAMITTMVAGIAFNANTVKQIEVGTYHMDPIQDYKAPNRLPIDGLSIIDHFNGKAESVYTGSMPIE